MKIYLTGSHSVGKSTLARYISEKLKLPLLNEVARTILTEKELQIDSLRSNVSLVDSYQTEIFYRQIAEENKLNSFVSDRSFDCLTYAAQHSTILPLLLNSQVCKDYINKLKNEAESGQSIFFFVRPSKLTLKNDGVREALTWDGIIAIDAMAKFMFQMWGIKHFQINTDSMQERINLIDAILSIKR